MHDGLTALAALLLVAAAVGFAARRLGVHYNIALVVAGAVPDLREGAALARESIDSGAARDRLARLAAITGAPAP